MDNRVILSLPFTCTLPILAYYILTSRQYWLWPLLLLPLSVLIIAPHKLLLLLIFPTLYLLIRYLSDSMSTLPEHLTGQGIYTFRSLSKYSGIINEGSHTVLVSTHGMSIQSGDQVSIKWSAIRLLPDQINNYYRLYGIHYRATHTQILKITHSPSLRKTIREYLLSNVDPRTRSYLQLLLFANKRENRGVYQQLQEMGIIAIIVISGMHISMLYRSLTSLFPKAMYQQIRMPFLLIITGYVWLINWPLPATRALLTLWIYAIIPSSYRRLPHLSFVILALLLVATILWDPRLICSPSYQLTYLFNYVVLLINRLHCRRMYRTYLLRYSIISLLSLSVSLLLQGYLILTQPLYMLLFTPLITLIYLISWCLLPLLTITAPLYQGLDSLIRYAYQYRLTLPVCCHLMLALSGIILVLCSTLSLAWIATNYRISSMSYARCIGLRKRW